MSDTIDNCTLQNSIVSGITTINSDLCINTQNTYLNSDLYIIGDYVISSKELEFKLRLLDKLLKEKFPEEFI